LFLPTVQRGLDACLGMDKIRDTGDFCRVIAIERLRNALRGRRLSDQERQTKVPGALSLETLRLPANALLPAAAHLRTPFSRTGELFKAIAHLRRMTAAPEQ
jgi:hypothetical protein